MGADRRGCRRTPRFFCALTGCVPQLAASAPVVVQFVKGLPFIKGHSSAGMAGAFARACNAQHLVLTHFSQRYVGAAATPAAAVAATAPHVDQASHAAGHQRVYAAQDLQVFHVAAHTAK